MLGTRADTSEPPASRYGSGARQRSPRSQRERDRDLDPRRRFPSPSNPDAGPRANPAGAQEREDWLSALSNFSDRLEALERNGRTHAQRNSAMDDKLTQIIDRVHTHDGEMKKADKQYWSL